MPPKLTVDFPAVNGGINYAPIVGKADDFPYKDGKKSSDVPIGVKLTLALQNARFSTLTVKFDHDPIPKIDDSQIQESCSACRFIFVQMTDCKVNLYSSNNGGIGMTATAQTAQVFTPGK